MFQNLGKFVLLLGFVAVSIFGCSKMLGVTRSDDTMLHAMRVKSVPIADGELDKMWADVPELIVALGETYDTNDPESITDCDGCHAYESRTKVTLKAVYTDTTLTILATWPDSTASFSRGGSWSFVDGSWTKANSEQSEDRIAFFWPIGEIEGDDYNTGGCMTKCHIAPIEDHHPSRHGIVDDAYLTKGRADMWHSKAARGAAALSAVGRGLRIDAATHEVIAGNLSMIGWVDDKYVDVWADESVNGEDGGRYGDDGSSAYSHNRIRDKSRPMFMEKDPADYTDAMFLLQSEIDGEQCVGEATKGVSDEDAALYWPNYTTLNAVVAERILKNPMGSRGDVRFGAKWNDGIWTVEISRRLKTGHSDDIQFELNEEFSFGVAIFDNSRHGYQHKTSEMYDMKFLR